MSEVRVDIKDKSYFGLVKAYAIAKQLRTQEGKVFDKDKDKALVFNIQTNYPLWAEYFVHKKMLGADSTLVVIDTIPLPKGGGMEGSMGFKVLAKISPSERTNRLFYQEAFKSKEELAAGRSETGAVAPAPLVSVPIPPSPASASLASEVGSVGTQVVPVVEKSRASVQTSEVSKKSEGGAVVSGMPIYTTEFKTLPQASVERRAIKVPAEIWPTQNKYDSSKKVVEIKMFGFDYYYFWEHKGVTYLWQADGRYAEAPFGRRNLIGYTPGKYWGKFKTKDGYETIDMESPPPKVSELGLKPDKTKAETPYSEWPFNKLDLRRNTNFEDDDEPAYVYKILEDDSKTRKATLRDGREVLVDTPGIKMAIRGYDIDQQYAYDPKTHFFLGVYSDVGFLYGLDFNYLAHKYRNLEEQYELEEKIGRWYVNTADIYKAEKRKEREKAEEEAEKKRREEYRAKKQKEKEEAEAILQRLNLKK